MLLLFFFKESPSNTTEEKVDIMQLFAKAQEKYNNQVYLKAMLQMVIFNPSTSTSDYHVTSPNNIHYILVQGKRCKCSSYSGSKRSPKTTDTFWAKRTSTAIPPTKPTTTGTVAKNIANSGHTAKEAKSTLYPCPLPVRKFVTVPCGERTIQRGGATEWCITSKGGTDK